VVAILIMFIVAGCAKILACEHCLQQIPPETERCPSEGPRRAQECFDIIHK